jgi:DNA-binding NarL/FixJ family response regulator
VHPFDSRSQTRRRVLVHARDEFTGSLLTDHLSKFPDLEVIGSAVTVEEVVDRVGRGSPDLVVSHAGTPPDDRSLRLAEKLRPGETGIDLVVFGSREEHTSPEEYRQAGATECLLAEATLDDLRDALGEPGGRRAG